MTASGNVVMWTPPTESVNPFFAASAFAATSACCGLLGRKMTPASAAASAARWIRRFMDQYQAMSMTTAHSAMSATSAPAKITRTWPRDASGA